MVNEFHHLPLANFGTILADPAWRFTNATGKVAPEHKRLHRYATMSFDEIRALPVQALALPRAHLYLWCPNALLAEGLATMRAWGFTYKTYIVWHKIRKDGGSDGRGVGFYFRNVTELVLFGIRGKHAKTREAGRRQVNYIGTRKREHSRKPDELYPIVEACSYPPFVELFATRIPFEHPDWSFFGKPHARRNEASGEIEIVEVDAIYREIEAQMEGSRL